MATPEIFTTQSDGTAIAYQPQTVARKVFCSRIFREKQSSMFKIIQGCAAQCKFKIVEDFAKIGRPSADKILFVHQSERKDRTTC